MEPAKKTEKRQVKLLEERPTKPAQSQQKDSKPSIDELLGMIENKLN